MAAAPDNLKYLPTHEWCRIEGDVATIGVTPNAVRELGDLIYADLPGKGEDVLQEIPFGEIEGTESIRELRSPADGLVEAVNPAVLSDPGVIARDPFEKGWLIRLKLDSPARMKPLLSAAEYEQIMRKKSR